MTSARKQSIVGSHVLPSALDSLRTQILHPDLSITDDYRLRLVRLDARSDEAQHKEIDLTSFWLPANGLYSKPQPIVHRPALVATIVLAVEKYFWRARRSKSRHDRASFIVTTLVKLFEYAWLRDLYSIGNLARRDFDDLGAALAKGGWHRALDVPQRLAAALAIDGHFLAAKLLSQGNNHLKCISPSALREHLGCNLAARELAVYHRLILDAYQGSLNEETSVPRLGNTAAAPGMGYSLLRQTLEAINLTLDLPNSEGARCVPFPDPVRLAKRMGRPQSRTRNLSAAEAGLLLAEAYKWLYVHGPVIREIIAGICGQVASAFDDGREVLGYQLDDWLASSSARDKLERQLGTKVTGLDMAAPMGLSIREAHMTLLSACFVLVATMNARRRDEVTHRKFGIHRGFTEVEDESLRLYKGTFYIEKTYQDYLQFYVNQTTRDAAVLLESIQDIFDSLNQRMGRPLLRSQPAREQSLFGYHRFSRIEGVNATRCWYEFENSRDGQASYFLQRALGEDYSLGAHPHMFRRMYALVFMYQHEIPSLQALSQQLGHGGLSTTKIYVTDPVMRDEAERISKKLDGSGRVRSKMFAAHIRGIEKQIDTVRDEKLIEIVLDIISGKPTSGGYPSYIRRFYRMVSGHVDMSALDLDRQAQVLSSALKKRGHVPNPSRHGQCMAGTQRRAASAKCHGPKAETRPHRGSATTCVKCPFQYVNANYLQNLEEDLARLEANAINSTLSPFERERSRIDADNLRIVISHHCARLNAS